MNEQAISQAIRQFDTPFYLFDTDRLSAQIRKIRAALGEKAELCYAMKANPFLVKAMENEVDFFEVCSPGEFHICERAAIDPGKIVLSGVYKNPKEIEYTMHRSGGCITYTVESLAQWQILNGLAAKYRLPVRVLLRLTTGNQFGMDENDVRHLIESRSENSCIEIEGIQYFSGTQKKTVGKIENEIRFLDDFCADLQRCFQFTVKRLEYGPGLPISYFDEEENAEDFMLGILAEQLHNLRFAGRIILEMGRFVAASCGFYVTGVVDMKVNKNQSYCIVDGGIHHINYYGQMLAMKKPPVVHWNEEAGEVREWTICGSLCTMNDVLARQFPLSSLHLGDRLIFERVGAYSVTEGISLFLSRELPQVVLYSKENGFVLGRGFFPTDTLNDIKT